LITTSGCNGIAANSIGVRSFALARRPDRPLIDESSASKDAHYGPKDENYNYARAAFAAHVMARTEGCDVKWPEKSGTLANAVTSAIAIFLVLALVGCVSPEERAEFDMRDAKATCAAAGLREGTLEFAECALVGFRDAQAAHEAARRRAAEGGATTVQPPQPPPPGKPVMCQPRGTLIICQ
jgi:hypothetical protein